MLFRFWGKREWRPGLGGTNLKIYPHGLTFLDAISAQLLHHWCNDPIHEFWSTQHGHAYQDLVILHSFSLVFNLSGCGQSFLSPWLAILSQKSIFFQVLPSLWSSIKMNWVRIGSKCHHVQRNSQVVVVSVFVMFYLCQMSKNGMLTRRPRSKGDVYF